MAHEHAHGHAGHHHGPAADADRRWLAVALGIIATFMVVEVVAGVLADSLALLSDAAHMLTDAGAIAVALYAAGLAARPPGGRFTFGLGRAEILSAQGNGATLLVLAGVIAVEAIRRLWSAPDVDGGFVLVVGLLGACANVGAAEAVGLRPRRRPERDARRDQREHERAGVGEHVRGVAEQRQRGRDDAEDDLDQHQADEQAERDPQTADRGVSRGVRVPGAVVVVVVVAHAMNDGAGGLGMFTP